MIVPPAHVIAAPDGFAITTPVGRVSEKVRFVAATLVAVLSMVKVSVLVPPAAIGSGLKAFENRGASAFRIQTV